MKYFKELFIHFPTTFYIKHVFDIVQLCVTTLFEGSSPSHLSSPQSLTMLTATAVAALGVP